MGKPVTEAEFGDLLASFTYSAFRWECQPRYEIGEEQAALDRFLAGQPQHPSEYKWWQDWLDQVERHTREGKTVSRVRILDDPRTDYQRWLLSGRRWHAQSGERIWYLSRGQAALIGLPLDDDWWLLDRERVIRMRFSPGGGPVSDELITGPDDIAPYLTWHDLAVRNAIPAEETAA